MRLNKRSEWQRDVRARQRNVVFPDTTANEARFWRNLITGRQKLSVSQIIGIVLVCLTLAAAVYVLVSTQLRVTDVQGTLWERVFSNFGIWIILVLIGAGILIAGQLIARRTKRPKGTSPR
jgi:H+/Cl- antiporter ClcA